MLACSVDCKWLGGNTTSASGSSVAFHLTIHQYPARCARPDVQTLAHAGSIPKSSRQTPLRSALQHSTISTPRGHHIASCKQAVNTKDYRTAAYEMKSEGRQGSSKVSAVACMLQLGNPSRTFMQCNSTNRVLRFLSQNAGETQVRLHDSVEIAACLDRLSVFTILCLTRC